MSGSPVESGVKMPRSPSGLTQSLVDLATGSQDWPPSVMVVSRQCLLDWIGVTIAGATNPGNRPYCRRSARSWQFRPIDLNRAE